VITGPISSKTERGICAHLLRRTTPVLLVRLSLVPLTRLRNDGSVARDRKGMAMPVYGLELTTDEFDAIAWGFLGSEFAEQIHADWPMDRRDDAYLRHHGLPSRSSAVWRRAKQPE
jgi:hypothetical protein